jgi:hypothetical protein
MNFVGPWLEMDQRPEAVPAGGFQILGRDISNSFASNLRFLSTSTQICVGLGSSCYSSRC